MSVQLFERTDLGRNLTRAIHLKDEVFVLINFRTNSVVEKCDQINVLFDESKAISDTGH
jgi:hypothetical protein